MKFTKIYWALVCTLALFLIPSDGQLKAQTFKDGDLITITMNGSATYLVDTVNNINCYRHGRYGSNNSYYQHPRGWKSVGTNSMQSKKLDMPTIGGEIYVLELYPDMKTGRWAYQAKKATLKQIGMKDYDSQKLGIRAEIKNDDGSRITKDFRHYATKSELDSIGWKVGAAAGPTVTEAELRKMEAEILATINEARHAPHTFAGKVANSYSKDPERDETIAFLQNISKSSHSFATLNRMTGMDKAAREHAKDAAKNGIGHKGTSADCSGTSQYLTCRLNRHGKVQKGAYTGENVFQGGYASPGAGVVMALMLDHGTPSRGHRAAFFDTYSNFLTADKKNAADYPCNYTTIGVGCVYESGKVVCVMDFADGYHNK